MGEFPSGQRGQTVNLLRFASVVRIHLLPPKNRVRITYSVFSWKKEGGFEGDCAEHSEAKTSQCDVFKESGKRAVSHLTHRKWRVGSFVKQKRNLLPPIFI